MKPSRRTHGPFPLKGFPPQVFLFARAPYDNPHHRSRRIADQLRSWAVPVTYVEESAGWLPSLTGRQTNFPRTLARSIKYHIGTAFARSSAPGRIAVREGRMDIVQMPQSVPISRFDSAGLERYTASLFRQTLVREVLPRCDNHFRSVALVNDPLWGLVLRKGDFDRVVYDCVADASHYAGLASLSRYLEYEQRLLGISDAVIAASAALRSHLHSRDARIRIALIPNGVDVGWFQETAAETRALPEIDRLSPPVIGYVGNISGWLNVGLVEAVARLLPAVNFLFVGPEDPWVNTDSVKRLPNVSFAGRMPYDETPCVIAACKACWMPLVGGAEADRDIPVKVFEYFALGKPVVATPLPELERYRRRGLLSVGTTAEEVAQAITKALAEDDEHLVLRRVRVAREHSWEKLITKVLRVLRGEA